MPLPYALWTTLAHWLWNLRRRTLELPSWSLHVGMMPERQCRPWWLQRHPHRCLNFLFVAVWKAPPLIQQMNQGSYIMFSQPGLFIYVVSSLYFQLSSWYVWDSLGVMIRRPWASDISIYSFLGIALTRGWMAETSKGSAWWSGPRCVDFRSQESYTRPQEFHRHSICSLLMTLKLLTWQQHVVDCLSP